MKIKITCKNCKKEFLFDKHNFANKYCSRKCYFENRNAPIIKTCAYCNKKFKTYQCKLRVKLGKYCSKECFEKKWNKNIKKTCLVCLKEFKTEPNILKKGKGKYCSLDCYSVIKKQNWANPEYKEKKIKQMNDRQHVFPNRPEKIIDTFLTKKYPKEWKYVGNGKAWFGDRNPDFMNINGQKKLIEVYGDYWHRGETGKDRIDHFKKYGFETLILWENEIMKNNFKQKIYSFIELGGKHV